MQIVGGGGGDAEVSFFRSTGEVFLNIFFCPKFIFYFSVQYSSIKNPVYKGARLSLHQRFINVSGISVAELPQIYILILLYIITKQTNIVIYNKISDISF